MQRGSVPHHCGQRPGQKKAFTPEEVKRVVKMLVKRGNIRDRALFCLAIKFMLRSEDLVSLRVGQVAYRSGGIRDTFTVAQRKTGANVTAMLDPPTCQAVADYLVVSGKGPDDFLFTAQGRTTAISTRQYRKLVKSWAASIGIRNLEDYAGHSTRRTRPVFLYRLGVPLGSISWGLGHGSLLATIVYLGITQEEVIADFRRHSLWGAADAVPLDQSPDVLWALKAQIDRALGVDAGKVPRVLRPQVGRVATNFRRHSLWG